MSIHKYNSQLCHHIILLNMRKSRGSNEGAHSWAAMGPSPSCLSSETDLFTSWHCLLCVAALPDPSFCENSAVQLLSSVRNQPSHGSEVRSARESMTHSTCMAVLIWRKEDLRTRVMEARPLVRSFYVDLIKQGSF